MRLNETREATAVLLTALKKNNFTVVMHPGIYESIWFKVGMMIDTDKLCISILVLIFIQGHRIARKQTLHINKSIWIKLV